MNSELHAVFGTNLGPARNLGSGNSVIGSSDKGPIRFYDDDRVVCAGPAGTGQGVFDNCSGAPLVSNLVGNFALNDSLDVAKIDGITCDGNVGGQAITVLAGGIPIVVADTCDMLFHSFERPSLNNLGAVAFFATLEIPGPISFHAIATGGAPSDIVIRRGDALFGSSVIALNVDVGRSLNNAGQIAFFAELADGRELIVRADPFHEPPPPPPPPPPEVLSGPSGFVMLAAGLLVIVGAAFTRRSAS